MPINLERKIKYLTYDQVIDLHKAVEKEKNVTPGIRCKQTLLLCLNCLTLKIGKDFLYECSFMKALMYVYLLIKKRPFNDGNKRTALEAWKLFYDLNEYRYDAAEISELQLLTNLISAEIVTKEDLLHFFQNHITNEWGRSLLSKP